MKQTLFSYALVIASALCLAGCGVKDDSASAPSKEKYFKKSICNSLVGISESIYSIEFEGHKYIIFSGFRQGGIIHSESCPCKKEVSK